MLTIILVSDTIKQFGIMLSQSNSCRLLTLLLLVNVQYSGGGGGGGGSCPGPLIGGGRIPLNCGGGGLIPLGGGGPRGGPRPETNSQH